MANGDVRSAYAQAAGTEFLWIAGLSVLHNAAIHFYGVIMMLGLGVQAVVNIELWATGGVNNRPLAMALDVALALPFVAAGVLARLGMRWVILPALGLYVADGVVVLWLLAKAPGNLMMTLALLFHGYMTYLIFDRWKRMQAAGAGRSGGGALSDQGANGGGGGALADLDRDPPKPVL